MNGDDGELSEEGSRRFHEAIRSGKAKVKFMTPTPPTDADVRRLMDLEAKATAGPWTWGMRYVAKVNDEAYGGYHHIAQTPSGEMSEEGEQWEKDAEFIAALRNLCRPICEELLRLREYVEQLESEARCCDQDYAKNLERLRAQLADAEARIAGKTI